MNKKLYIALLAIIAGNCVATDYVRSVGRTLNGSGVLAQEPVERISFSEAKKIKRDLNETTKKIANVSRKNSELIKAKIANLNDLIEKSQVSKKSRK